MTLLPWLVVVVLLAVNALYVAAEFAAVSVDRAGLSQLAGTGHRRATALFDLLGDGVQLDRYIAACQIGITLSSLVVGAYGQATIGMELAPLLERGFGLDAIAALSVSAVSVLLVLSTLQLVLGELVPKSLALQFSQRVALFTFVPTRWSMSLYRPFIWFMNGSALLLLRPFGVTAGGHQHVHSPAEIALLLTESRRGGELSPEAHARLQRGLKISLRTVRQLMVPRGELVAIDASTPPAEMMRRVLESPYSRVPIYRGSLDEVIGAVSAKDIAFHAVRGEVPALEDVLRPIPFVPEHLTADRLVRFLQEKRTTKALVVDEFGGVQGLVSIDDVLGALFGHLGDELEADASSDVAERLADGWIRVRGSLPLDEAESQLGIRWAGHAATLGGHIVSQLGRLPKEDQALELDGVEVVIERMSPTAIRWVRVRPKSADDEPEERP